ncbi:MAG: TonB-dependent receptor [Ignavibacteriae bacterium]|nr:TonB-dependent receptor [Ignavibacteriota bacterium]NOG99548.1 TonB-dependent receptor [Ignavibacteriota bacterium]
MKNLLIISILYLTIFHASIRAQLLNSADSLSEYTLDEIIITPDKFNNYTYSSASSVEKIKKEKISSIPITHLAELFNYIPGYIISSVDGVGGLPIISTRGFYGGGESEYLSVYLDGKQVNDLLNGLVNWNFINPNNIDHIEVMKGGASPIYGNAAIGGVLNISSSNLKKKYLNINLKGGSFSSYGLSILSNNHYFSLPYNLYASFDKRNGARNHSNYKNYSFGGSILISSGKLSTFRISTNNHVIKSEVPGPLDSETLFRNRSFSIPYYKFDINDEQRYNVGVIFKSKFSEKSSIDLSLIYNKSNLNNIRTFMNAIPIVDPITFAQIGIYDTTLYGDTKRNQQKINRISSEIKYYSEIPLLNTRLILGGEANYGSYNNKYYDLFNGFYSDYESNNYHEEILSVDGEGNRLNSALFINTEIEILSHLKLFAGVRYDYINDKYDNFLPDSSLKISSSAYSPKIGINFNYAHSKDYVASIYINVNKSFKAPTINQLLDFKELNFGVFVPIGPDKIFQSIKADPFGNTLLKPQKSINYEIGTYQMMQFSDDLNGELSFALYHTEVRDEIDFDLMSFKYGNINESLHQGIEAGLKLNFKSYLQLFLNYTYTRAIFANGTYKNNQLKNIPKHYISSGLSYISSIGISAMLAMRALDETYIDDENLNYLPGYIIFDTQLGYKFNAFQLILKIKNLFNIKYNSSGYMINDEQYLFPNAGRFMSLNLVYNY